MHYLLLIIFLCHIHFLAGMHSSLLWIYQRPPINELFPDIGPVDAIPDAIINASSTKASLIVKTQAPMSDDTEKPLAQIVQAIRTKKQKQGASFKRHCKKRKQFMSFQCPLCNHECKGEQALSHHINRKHASTNIEGDDRLACNKCNKKFKRYTSLNLHKRSTHLASY